MKTLFSVMSYLQRNCRLGLISRSGPTYKRQVVNPRHKTPQGQSVAKPGTPLYNILLEDISLSLRLLMQYSVIK